MQIRLHDGIATLLVAAVVVPYVGYLVNGSMPFVEDVTGMAAVGLVIALVAVSVIGPDGFRGTWGRVATVTGVAAALLGVSAVFVGETWAIGDTLLASFVGSTVVTWLIAVLIDIRVLRSGGVRPLDDDRAVRRGLSSPVLVPQRHRGVRRRLGD
ncbi:hypothetical protein [Pseudonocardia sp.]|uniref:hypothetical protein n=1 Tax=Pseudonocardia sp. TaxID=60912 RepID=UPI0026045AD4|nr:hypothetical protein [Pseudonocardia sp.]